MSWFSGYRPPLSPPEREIKVFRTGDKVPSDARFMSTLIAGRDIMHYFTVPVQQKKKS